MPNIRQTVWFAEWLAARLPRIWRSDAVTRAKTEIKPYDPAAYLETPKDVAAYLEEAFRESDPALIAHALGVAARARGMSLVAKQAKLSRESLYRALSADGNPELGTLIKVLHTLGLRLAVEIEKPQA